MKGAQPLAIVRSNLTIYLVDDLLVVRRPDGSLLWRCTRAETLELFVLMRLARDTNGRSLFTSSGAIKVINATEEWSVFIELWFGASGAGGMITLSGRDCTAMTDRYRAAVGDDAYIAALARHDELDDTGRLRRKVG